MKVPRISKRGSNQLFSVFFSGLFLLNYAFCVNTTKVVCNACIYRPVVSNLNTHFYGSKSNIVDFEFQIPCTFYNPMITVSIPKSYKINQLKLLPSNKIGKFEDYETNCVEDESHIEHKVEKGVVEKSSYIDNKNSPSPFDKIVNNQLFSCDLGKDAENELFQVFTSLGFQTWQIVSQNSSKCLEVPKYETKGTESLKMMGNLLNGSYVLRFDLQNPIEEEFTGNWNLSITSTKNNLPTTPFCLTHIDQTSVSGTLGPMLGPLNVKNATFNSYYTGSQKGEFSFIIDSLKWNGSKGLNQQMSKIGESEPIKIRLTFPLCENQNDCYSINSKNSETFCQIYGHKYECYLERNRPELVLSIGLSEAISNNDLSSVFPLKVRIKDLIIPLRSESNYKLKIEVLVPSAPISKPEFLNLNVSTVEAITKKNQCIGQWIKFLIKNQTFSNFMNNNNTNLSYSSVSIGTYKLPKTRDIGIQIRYRISNSETYPIILKIGKMNDKVQGSYNIRVKSLVEGTQFVKKGLNQRIAYSNILLNALIYDKSKLQEELSIEFETKSDSILLRNVDPNNPLECILLVEGYKSKRNSKYQENIFEVQKKEWEVEIFSIVDDMVEDKEENVQVITKKVILGEILDPRETEISEIGGPFVFVDSEEKYSMVIYFFLIGHQYNKMMTISMLIPKSITEYVNADLNVRVIPPESHEVSKIILGGGVKVTKFAKGRILALTLESNEGFREGWWGVSVDITRPIVVSSANLTEYIEFNVSSSVSTMNSPYLTSLLFLSVHENFKGPYKSPIANKLQYIKGENYIFQIISVQQSHSSFHPFPMLKDQIVGLETNSPNYLVTKLMYMEKFRFLYIISEPSLNGKEIDIVTREIGNLGSSSCQIILILGNGYYKDSKCDKVIKYSRLDKERDTNKNSGSKDVNFALVKKLLSKFLISKNKFTMSLITLVIEENDIETYDNGIYSEDDTSPNERVNYNFIIKKKSKVNTRKLRLDPNPTYYESYYQFRKALISSHYYNLYTVPSSIQALKVCPPEVPILSQDKKSSQPLVLKYKFFREIISSYNYSVTPNIPGTCIKQRLITSNSTNTKIPGVLTISLILLLILI